MYNQKNKFTQFNLVEWSDPLINTIGIIPIYFDKKHYWIGLDYTNSIINPMQGHFDNNKDYDLIDTIIRVYSNMTNKLLHIEELISCKVILSNNITVIVLYVKYIYNINNLLWVTDEQLNKMINLNLNDCKLNMYADEHKLFIFDSPLIMVSIIEMIKNNIYINTSVPLIIPERIKKSENVELIATENINRGMECIESFYKQMNIINEVLKKYPDGVVYQTLKRHFNEKKIFFQILTLNNLISKGLVYVKNGIIFL